MGPGALVPELREEAAGSGLEALELVTGHRLAPVASAAPDRPCKERMVAARLLPLRRCEHRRLGLDAEERAQPAQLLVRRRDQVLVAQLVVAARADVGPEGARRPDLVSPLPREGEGRARS